MSVKSNVTGNVLVLAHGERAFLAVSHTRLLRDYPMAWRKVCHLGLLLPDGSPFIEDPYSGGPAVFREAYGLIARAIESISPGATKRAHSMMKDDAAC